VNIKRWGCLLAAVVERHSHLHIVFIAGNHDSLLCTQGAGCVSCNFPPAGDARKRWPLTTMSTIAPLPSSSQPQREQSSAVTELFASIPSHHHPRVHYLDHEYVDIDLNPNHKPKACDALMSVTKDLPSSSRGLSQPDTCTDGASAPPLFPSPSRCHRRRVVRVFGSAWTPQYHGGLNQHFTYPARSGNEDHTQFWQAKW